MSKSKNVPAYLTLVVDILTRADALGLTVERDMSNVSTLPENSGFVFVRVDGGTAACIIPKQADSVKWCDSHIDWEGEAGYVDHRGGGGAVQCRIDPSETDLDAYLKRLSGAKKADRKGASKKASQADMASLLAKLQTLGVKAPAAAQPAASQTPPAPAPQPEEEVLTEEDVADLA